MALNYKKVEYQGTGDFTFEDMGTVASNFKGHSLRFTKKNLASDKRVTLIAKKGDKEFILPCSEPLSKVIRKALEGGKSQRDVLSVIAKLNVFQSEDGERYFVMQPAGDQLEAFAVDSLAKSEELSWEDVAF
jgi:hypothetical protein